jgi:hypothetical protein
MLRAYGVFAGVTRRRWLEFVGISICRMHMPRRQTMAPTLSNLEPTAVELKRGATKVGVLVPENERAMRLVVTDVRYRLLDGSRFPSLRQAELTVQRLANFVDRPPAAHAA